jgi:hypothetical protein
VPAKQTISQIPAMDSAGIKQGVIFIPSWDGLKIETDKNKFSAAQP